MPLVPTLNILLLAICAVFLWLLIDRAFLSTSYLGIQPEPLRPLRNDVQLTWYRAGATPPVAPPVAQVDPDAALGNADVNAQLLGTLVHSQYAFAAIQTPRVPDGLYQVGDMINTDIEILRIEADRVVVRERGLERQILLKSLADSGPADQGQLVRDLPTVEPPQTEGFSLAGVVGAAPINHPEHGLGLRLDSLDEEVARMSNLQSRDVIFTVGGQPISALVANPLLWQQFMQQTLVPVTVLRDEQIIEVSVNARSIGERILPQLGQGLVQ